MSLMRLEMQNREDREAVGLGAARGALIAEGDSNGRHTDSY